MALGIEGISFLFCKGWLYTLQKVQDKVNATFRTRSVFCFVRAHVEKVGNLKTLRCLLTRRGDRKTPELLGNFDQEDGMDDNGD